MKICPPPEICPVCLKTSEFNFLRLYAFKDSSFSLYECSGCEAQFWLPFKNPGAEWYEEQENYRLKEPKIYRGYHKMFLKSHPSFAKGTRVLDVGCGTGELLGELHKRGCEVWGVDADKRDIETARKYFGLRNLYAMPLGDFFRKPELPLFDIVTFFEVLEHLDDPLEFIRNVKKILKPGGRIVLSVPSRDRMLVNLYEWDFPPYHLSRWNESAIRKLFERINFKPDYINYADAKMHFLELFYSLLKNRPPRRRLNRLIGTRLECYIFVLLPALILWFAGVVSRPVTKIRNGVIVVELILQERKEEI